MRAALALATLIALGVPDAPRTFSDVKRALPKAKPARATALFTFARDERVAIQDRLRAAQAALPEFPARDPQRLDGELLVARLEGVRGRAAARAKALKRAKRHATTTKDKRGPAVLAVLAADARAMALGRATRRARAPLDDATRALLVIDDEVRALEAVADAPAAARLTLVAAELAAAGGLVDDALALAGRVDARAGAARDAQGTVRAARQLRARLHEAAARPYDAARESLAADLVVVVPPHQPAFDPPPAAAYRRSKETHLRCRALLGSPKTCADAERALGVEATFYDWSREQSPDGFDEERAVIVLEDYQPLLFACVKTAAKDRAFDARHLEIEWTVANDGTTTNHAVKPERVAPMLLPCASAALARFRYPRYPGELHHVVLPFDVGD